MRRRSLANFGTIGPTRHTAQHGALLNVSAGLRLVVSSSPAPLTVPLLPSCAWLLLSVCSVGLPVAIVGAVASSPPGLPSTAGRAETLTVGLLVVFLQRSFSCSVSSLPQLSGEFLSGCTLEPLFPREGAGAVFHCISSVCSGSVHCRCTHGSLWAFRCHLFSLMVTPACPEVSL